MVEGKVGKFYQEICSEWVQLHIIIVIINLKEPLLLLSIMINTIICIIMSTITSTIKVAEEEGQKFGRRVEVLEYSLQQLQVFIMTIKMLNDVFAQKEEESSSADLLISELLLPKTSTASLGSLAP